MRVLDGAVCILDGVAGVEAQTEKVWRQANVYHIPRIIYVNKLDRDGASFSKTVREIGTRLMRWPAVCQIPWWDKTGAHFIGLGDVVRLRGLKWERSGDGKAISPFDLQGLQNEDPNLAEELKKARIALVELLSEYDDQMVERYLEHDEDHLSIPPSDILNSLRRCLGNQPGRIVPTFAGASFKNIGVQPLLDAVVDLLPDPSERPDVKAEKSSSKAVLNGLQERGLSGIQDAEQSNVSMENAVITTKNPSVSSTANIGGYGLAFKVANDARRGVLVYVRVYSGSIQRSAMLFNTNLKVPERANRLLRMYAADAEEISEITAGQIGVITGLNHARTGDTLISFTGVNPKKGPPAPWNDLRLQAIDAPPTGLLYQHRAA